MVAVRSVSPYHNLDNIASTGLFRRVISSASGSPYGAVLTLFWWHLAQIMATVSSAQSLLKRSKKCTSGCLVLDSFLRGGFPCGSVTELVGESASAKTQFCLQLSLAVQLPASEGGLNGSALYVYTENYFPYRRLQEIANHMVETRWKKSRAFASNVRPLRSLDVNKMAFGEALNPVKTPGNLVESRVASAVCEGAGNPCNRVFVQGIQTAENLLEYLDFAYTLLTHPLLIPVKVIIIDSMAALFRSDFDNTVDEMKKRASLYFQVATKLKKYADEFNLAVVVTNQVTDSFQQESLLSKSVFGMSWMQDGEILVTSGRRVAPALALSWAHCVNTRLFLSRSNGSGDVVKRSVQVVFAPHLPNEACEFAVNSKGVQGLSMRLSGLRKENGALETPPHKQVDFLSTSRILVTPPHCSVDKREDSPSSAADSCERLFQISQSRRVVGTPPYTSMKRKDEVRANARGNINVHLKLFR